MEGLCDLTDPDVRARYYASLRVGEVWGIGGKSADKLERAAIRTIQDFLREPVPKVRQLLTVIGVRIQAELRGVSCLPLAEAPMPRKGIACTRSFGRPITQLQEMRQAISSYATLAAEKLRAEGLVAGHLTVFLHTNPHSKNEPSHSGQRSASIEPTADAIALIGEATRLLEPLWKDGHRYSKAGVMLNDLEPAALQATRFFFSRDTKRAAKLMATLDAVNSRYGRNTMHPLATGLKQPWASRTSRKSRCYTTKVDELMEANAW